MVELLVGIDIGATKTAFVATTRSGDVVVDTTVASTGWDAEPIQYGAQWILTLLQGLLPDGAAAASVGVGAQGLDTAELSTMLGAALQRHGVRAWCMNDAALLLPAAGIDHGIGVIAGTGCIAVGADTAGRQLITGGWGSILGDDAGAAGIVRDATRAALYGHDDGIPDDGLLAALMVAFEVETAERLARCVNDNPAAHHWGVAAPAVFAAADAGSVLARGVVSAAGQHLVRLVDQLVRRQAVGTTVVAAGSVIAHQPRLLDAFRENLRISQPHLQVQLLLEAPVTGALTLARRLQSETSGS